MTMRWENQDGPGPSPAISSIEVAARRSLEASLRRRRPVGRLEALAVAAPALVVIVGLIVIYVLAGVLTGGPR